MKKNVKKHSILSQAIIGIMMEIAILIISYCIISLLILNEKLSGSIVESAEFGVLLMGSYVGTIMALRKPQSGHTIISALIAAGMIALLVVINIIFFEARFYRPWSEVISISLGSSLAYTTKLKQPGKKSRKYRYR